MSVLLPSVGISRKMNNNNLENTFHIFPPKWFHVSNENSWFGCRACKPYFFYFMTSFKAINLRIKRLITFLFYKLNILAHEGYLKLLNL